MAAQNDNAQTDQKAKEDCGCKDKKSNGEWSTWQKAGAWGGGAVILGAVGWLVWKKFSPIGGVTPG
jgi:hypothetical protein